MTLLLYILCGIPWTVYSLARRIRFPRVNQTWKDLMICAAVAWVLWPVLPVWIAFTNPPPPASSR